MTKNNNFIYLTIALSLLLFSVAMAEQLFDASVQRLVQSTTVITLLFIVWGVEGRIKIFQSTAFFPLAIIISAALGYVLDLQGLKYMHLIIMLFFFILTAYQTAKQVLFCGHVNGNQILGAICLYL